MNPRTSLGRQLLFRMLGYVLLCSLALLGWQHIRHEESLQKQLADIPEQIRRQNMPLLAQSVWDLDQATIQQLLSGMLDYPGVAEVTLTTPQGKVLLHLRREEDVSHQAELPVLSARTGNQPLAHLRLGLSLDTLQTARQLATLRQYLELLLALTGLAALSYHFLRQRILQPIHGLRQQLALPAPPSDAAHDELADLAANLNAQHRQQQQLDTRHRQQEDELARHRDHLTELVAMRTAELEHLSRFQQLISELSTRFIHRNLQELPHEIDLALARIGTLLGVDRCYLFRISPALTIQDNQEWCADGIPSTAHFYEHYPLAESTWFIPLLMRQQLVALGKLEEIPPEGYQERQRFALHGIQSIVVSTLSYQGQLLGFFGCDAVSRHREWLTKELSLIRLISELLGSVLLRKQQMTELDRTQLALAQANEKLEAMANTDGLTGLPNRRRFDQTRQQELAIASSLKQPLSLLLIDVDFFKAYNDNFGHLEGDQCLIAIARALQAHFASSEQLPARIGGEEFAVLLPNQTHEEACALAETFRRTIEALALPHIASSIAPHVTVSIGVATLDLMQHSNTDDLMKEADNHLYLAKRQGRNRVIGARPLLTV